MRALFLDRDGVINVEKEYLYRQEEVQFIEGIFDVCRYFHAKGFVIIIVTNQSGIARGMYTNEDFHTLMTWMQARFEKEGAPITHVYYCPHHPDFSLPCACRKPASGMFIEAQKTYDIDMAASIMIGDAERDITAALNAGVGLNFLLTHDEVPTKANYRIARLEEVYAYV